MLMFNLVGKVSEQKVSLARFIPFVGNPFAPVFYGSFQVRDGVTVLEGHFAFPLYSRIYHAIGLGFCLIMAVICPITAFINPVSSSPPMPQWQAKLFLGLLPSVMVLFFVFYIKLSKWFARNDIPFITNRVQDVFQRNQTA
jgi:hypothetical protein